MEFKLPEMGEGVNEGELTKWRVQPGDEVSEDQALCEVMTDKATVELPAPFSGRITQLLVKEGETIHVGTPILSYETELAKQTQPMSREAARPQPEVRREEPRREEPRREEARREEARPPVETRVAAAPATRRFAREAGVDLSAVPPSGPGGRVVREDVERYTGGPRAARMQAVPQTVPVAEAKPQPAAPMGGEQRVPLIGIRKKIAEHMRLSKSRAAHYTYVEECDMTELVRLREDAKRTGAQQGIKVTYVPFLMKALVIALKQYPIVNSSLDEERGELVYKHYYNIGLSVQTNDGLLAPVIKGVDRKSILEIAREVSELAEKARAGKLNLDEMRGGTITLTNAGSIGGLFATPVINYPEVAILGFNKIFKKPVVLNEGGQERIVSRDWSYFSLSLDHRAVDGAIAAEFMKVFLRYIEQPARMLFVA